MAVLCPECDSPISVDTEEVEQGETIQCECPVYNGTYQVGAAKQACTIPPNGTTSYVWSAANNVAAGAAAGGGN